MVAWVPARHYAPSRLGRVDLLVLHTAEGPRTAEALGRYFATTDRRASAHAGVDDDGRVDYVRPEHTAYAAPGANADGEQLELCGWARWTRDEWLGGHAGMLEQAARWLVERSTARSIPLTLLGPDQLRADQRGVTTHDAVSKAFGRSTHWDPGPGFPADVVLARAKALTAGTPAVQVARPAQVQVPLFPNRLLRVGAVGPDVLAYQRRMRQRGWALAVDGRYGPQTERVTRAFQRERNVTPDGIVGPVTWRLAWTARVTR